MRWLGLVTAMAVLFAGDARARGPAAVATVAVAGPTSIAIVEIAGDDTVRRLRRVTVAGARAVAWDPDGTLWALDDEQRIWKVGPRETRGRLQPAPMAPGDKRPRRRRELDLFAGADGRATVEICDDKGDYNDAPSCLATYHGPLATGLLTVGRGVRKIATESPPGYAVAIDVPTDPETKRTFGWYLACTAPGREAVRIFADRAPTQIFQTRWVATSPPVIAASLIWPDGALAEWRAIPACDGTTGVRLGGIENRRRTDPVVGPAGVWGSHGDAGWTIRRGMIVIESFPRAVAIAITGR